VQKSFIIKVYCWNIFYFRLDFKHTHAAAFFQSLKRKTAPRFMILVRTMLQDFYFTSFTHFLFALVRGFNGTSPALAISAATPPQEAASLPHRSASSKKSWAVEALSM
jgi:hypothetical protein